MTLEEKLARVQPVLIGLWRFHHSSWEEPKWCCTWRHKGNYHDTFAKPTAAQALDSVWKNWNQIKKKK
jgi:hypothetical protein